MTTMMMWMMLSDLSLRASSLHRGSGRFSPALALAVRAMYNVYNKQQTQNTSYLTQMCWCGLEEMQFEVDDVQNSFVLWCGKDVQQYIRVQSGEFLLIRLSITAHRLAGGCWGFFTQISSISVIIEERILFSKEANFAMVLLPLRYRSLFHCGWFRGGIATLPPLCSLYLPKIKHLPIPFSSHWHIVWRKRPTPSTSEPENWL